MPAVWYNEITPVKQGECFMKKLQKMPKIGKISPIFLILFIIVVFLANLFKSTTLGSHSLDAAPMVTQSPLETISLPTRPTELAHSFVGKHPAATTAVARTATSATSTPSAINFSAPIYNVADMNYGGLYYNYNAIMHHTFYTHFYYAHDTGAFAKLKNLTTGSIFILDGVKYQAQRVTFIDYATAAQTMASIANARYDGTQYDISMMTCAGSRNQATKNGVTNTHRIIVYANRI